MLSFTAYKQQLITLNKDYLINYKTPLDYTSLSNAHRFADLGFCLVEELLEFSEAVADCSFPKFLCVSDYDNYCEKLTKEAGDVLVFVVLLADALGGDVELATLEDIGHTVSLPPVTEVARKLARSFRQWFRNGEEIDFDQILLALSAVLGVCTDHSITLAEIMQVNLNKLVSRFERGVMFTGEGDNR